MDTALKEKIEQMVKNNKVFLFMKGTPQSPMCGFSARASAVLNDLGVDFKSFNILEDEAIRHGLKEYSDWPTFPQLYVNGEFIGGCDIMMEMNESGELAEIINQSTK